MQSVFCQGLIRIERTRAQRIRLAVTTPVPCSRDAGPPARAHSLVALPPVEPSLVGLDTAEPTPVEPAAPARPQVDSTTYKRAMFVPASFGAPVPDPAVVEPAVVEPVEPVVIALAPAVPARRGLVDALRQLVWWSLATLRFSGAR